MKGAASRGNKVSYGEFGIQAMEPGWITGNQIEAARVAMTRYTKRGGQVWIKIFPDKPVSKKALGVRMGSGKGAPEYWVAVVKNQKVMFEIGGVSEAEAREALRLAQHKLERLVNRKKYLEKGERTKRTHRLCNLGGTIESLAPEVKDLTRTEMTELMEHIFSLSEVQRAVRHMAITHTNQANREKELKADGTISSERHAD